MKNSRADYSIRCTKLADRKIVALSFICVTLLVVSLGTLTLYFQKDIELKSEVEFLNDENNALELEIDGLQSEKTSYELQISTLQSEKTSLTNQMNEMESQVSSLENQVTESYNDGLDEGEAIGYQKGVLDGVGTGYNIRDPTYAEALAFIESDKTNEKSYDEDSYLCWNFVADFKNNAFETGYRAGDVYIEFPDSAHAITCFYTTDKGLIFIEPQDDNIVDLTVGQPYWNKELYEVEYDDTIVRYDIIW
jgi:hypothetical protein